MQGLTGIRESKKFIFGICYVALAAVLLAFGYITGQEWVEATRLVVSALMVAQAYQDRHKFLGRPD